MIYTHKELNPYESLKKKIKIQSTYLLIISSYLATSKLERKWKKNVYWDKLVI